MIARITSIICALLLAFGGLRAGENQPLALTLESSIAMALEHNPDFQIAQKELQKSGADIRIAYSQILPQLNASANLQHAWTIQESTIPNFIKTMLGPSAPPGMPDFVNIAFGLENSLTYGASLSQPLYLGGAGIAGIKAAYAAEKASMAAMESKKQNLLLQTTDAFYACLLAEELINVQQEALKQAEANLDIVLKKYKAGSASGFDKMRAEVEVANLRPELISARNNRQNALTRLRTIIGLSTDAAISVSGELTFTSEEFDSLSLAELQKMAAEKRPERQIAEQQMEIGRRGITIARSAFLPKLFFATDFSYLASRNDFNFSSDDFNQGFTSGISLQIPLFSGFRSSQEYQKAQIDLKIVQQNDKQISDGIAAEVELAHNKFREAQQKFRSANETVKLAAEALRLAGLLYEEGSNTQLDVLNSRLALTQARMNYARSLYEYQVARYQLHKATGSLHGIL